MSSEWFGMGVDMRTAVMRDRSFGWWTCSSRSRYAVAAATAAPPHRGPGRFESAAPPAASGREALAREAVDDVVEPGGEGPVRIGLVVLELVEDAAEERPLGARRLLVAHARAQAHADALVPAPPQLGGRVRVTGLERGDEVVGRRVLV